MAAGDPVTVAQGLEQLWTIVDECVTFFSHNVIMMTLLVASLVVVGFKIFKRAKKAAKA